MQGRLSKWMGVIFAVWTLAAVWFYLDGAARLGTRSELQPSRIKEVDGLAYRYKPANAEIADAVRWQAATLFEDGKTMPHTALPKERVALTGQGTYVLLPKNLWFSSTDGSDPRTNGKRYEILLPKMLPAGIQGWIQHAWALWFVAFVLLSWHREIMAGLRVAALSPFWRTVAAIALLRLVLVSFDEIVATISDQEDYTRLAFGWYYHGNPIYFGRPPVYPLFLALSSTTGVPLRFIIELVQLSAYALLAGVMVRCGIPRWAALVAFAWMALLPQTGDCNNYTMSETLYVPGILIMISLGMLWMATSSRRYALLCGLTMGLLMNLREERIIAVAIIGSLLMAYAFQEWWYGRSKTGGADWGFVFWLKRVTLAALPIVLTAAVLDVAFLAAFHARTGLRGRCLVSTRGLCNFMDGMYRIPHDNPPQRYFLIDKSVRDKASELSPTFRAQQHFYENEEFGYLEGMKKDTGIRDLAAGWFLWVPLQGDAFSDGKPDAALYRDEMFQKAADEIHRGLAGHEQQTIFLGGTFPINTTALKALAGNWRELLKECWDVSFWPPQEGAYPQVGPPGPQLIQIYDEVTNRRSSLATKVDDGQVTRPAWVQSIWRLLYRIQMIAVKVAEACLILAVLIFLARCVRRGLALPRERLQGGLILFLLSVAGLSRLPFNCMTGIYFIGGIQPRYMLAFTVMSVPLAVLALALATGRKAPATAVK